MTSREKHVPVRTCAGCGRRAPRGELIRLTAGPGGGLAIDVAGRRPGRGAYLCPERRCLESALKRRRLERSLRVHLTDDQRTEIFGQRIFRDNIGTIDS
jgi:predicted RNA-binding protein YlxR (DUF448 family)